MKKTLISLFSSAGVGDYGFKTEGFETVATNELLDERMNIQKLNKKCKYDSGYISGDITLESTKQLIMDEITFWENKYKIPYVDVLVATPPCQGMSTANFKKSNELPRNSLVIESLSLIKRIMPRYFILENVKSFLNTQCLDVDKKFKKIEQAIMDNLEEEYNIHMDVINFKEYGIPSSRPRTLVIGTRKDMPNLSPLLVFPSFQKEIPLKESIGHFRSLNKFNEFDEDNPLHMFREYPGYMREWISDLKEGEDSFNSSRVKPYKIVEGAKIALKGKHLGNKFSRMYWDRPAPAIHTRSDQLASNRTLHPKDDRVLSIAELMCVMSIPSSFIWFDNSLYEKAKDKIQFLRKRELNIRRSIGEAVPTGIFEQIAKNIKLVDKNPFQLFYKLQYESGRMEKSSAFYTPQSVIFNIIKSIDTAKYKKRKVRILEPSAGWGSFLPQIVKKFQSCAEVEITLMDIDGDALKQGHKLFSKVQVPSNVKIKWIKGDFLEADLKHYDFIIGNPPYKKIGMKNLYSLFLNKVTEIADNFAFIVPKTILNSDADLALRNKILDKFNIDSLIEFGVRTFPGVNIETLSINATHSKNNGVKISRYFGRSFIQPAEYIFLKNIWIPYRNEDFDRLYSKMEFDIFKSFRDRQITNKYLKESGNVKVLKSKNLLKNKILSIDGYNKFIDDISPFTVSKYINKKIIIMPNFTYNMRAAILPKNSIGNGSIVFLDIKDGKNIDYKLALKLYNSQEFNKYYAVLQSYSKFTININKVITYYIGVINEKN